MGQELNIKFLENQDCCFTAVDSTRIPLDSNNKMNRAFIEFLIKNNNIVFNIVNEAEKESDVMNNTVIPTESDGLFKYYKLVIPTLEYFKAGTSSYNIAKDKFFYYNQKVYKTNSVVTSVSAIESSCTKMTSIMDIWNARQSDNNIFYAYKEFFSMCRIKNCLLSKVAAIDSEYEGDNCDLKCSTSVDLITKRDFMLSTLYVLNYLVELEDYTEADRILNIILSCDDSLCPQNYIGKVNDGGCNCGKS